jgi:ribosomal RNA adenine dimethylase
METDHEIAALADPRLGQHFLVSAEKLTKLVTAADIRPGDDVLEVGAGIGTVAKVLPESRSLTVVELDERLIGFLRQNVPHATVLQGHANSSKARTSSGTQRCTQRLLVYPTPTQLLLMTCLRDAQPADMDRDKTWLSVSGLDVPMPLSNGGDDAAV